MAAKAQKKGSTGESLVEESSSKATSTAPEVVDSGSSARINASNETAKSQGVSDEASKKATKVVDGSAEVPKTSAKSNKSDKESSKATKAAEVSESPKSETTKSKSQGASTEAPKKQASTGSLPPIEDDEVDTKSKSKSKSTKAPAEVKDEKDEKKATPEAVKIKDKPAKSKAEAPAKGEEKEEVDDESVEEDPNIVAVTPKAGPRTTGPRGRGRGRGGAGPRGRGNQRGRGGAGTSRGDNTSGNQRGRGGAIGGNQRPLKRGERPALEYKLLTHTDEGAWNRFMKDCKESNDEHITIHVSSVKPENPRFVHPQARRIENGECLSVDGKRGVAIRLTRGQFCRISFSPTSEGREIIFTEDCGGGINCEPLKGFPRLAPGQSIIFKVSGAFPDFLYYQDSSDEFMGGPIIIRPRPQEHRHHHHHHSRSPSGSRSPSPSRSASPPPRRRKSKSPPRRRPAAHRHRSTDSGDDDEATEYK